MTQMQRLVKPERGNKVISWKDTFAHGEVISNKAGVEWKSESSDTVYSEAKKERGGRREKQKV